MTSTAIRTSPLYAFAEDRQAAWVPDVLGWADTEGLWHAVYDSAHRRPAAEAVLAQPGSRSRWIETIRVPKPDGGTTNAPILDASMVARLHLATDALRDAADAALTPGVCGYRRGAEAGYSYSSENLRFHEFSQAEAESASFVALADVESFFENVPWSLVLESAAKLVPADDLNDLLALGRDAERAGLRCLPAGYADSRLLSNLVLHRVDTVIRDSVASSDAPVRFTRWVDDYRIFVDSEHEAAERLGDLRRALATFGLKLNESKTEVVPAVQFIASAGNSLQSVYHPDIETSDQVRAALRSVFLEAAADPVAKRRSLRFTLPRLAIEDDDVAVDWALEMLTQIPWDAPRLCRYLGAFAGRADVAERVESRLVEAAADPASAWLACRIAALACRSGVSAQVAPVLVDHLAASSSDALWGLGLRALALSGHSHDVHRLLQHDVRDTRAAAGALTDLGEHEAVSDLDGVEAATLHLLAHGPAPLPALDAIL